jgi:large subunit ribosomal protein L10
MNKEQKTALVEELARELGEADAIFAVDYRGISVPQAAELRASLREAETRFRIVKNRLTLRAAEQAGVEELKEHLSGPTAIAFVKGDAALAAKAISSRGADWKLLDYKGGLMDGEPLDADTFQSIARLPGLEVLRGQFAGVVASPLTGLVRGLGSMIQGLAVQLQQISDQGLVGEGGSEPDPDPKESPEEESSEQAPGAERSDPDPAPEESPEERTEEEAPTGEEAGQQVEPTEEGDAEVGEAQEEVSEDSDDEKEDG